MAYNVYGKIILTALAALLLAGCGGGFPTPAQEPLRVEWTLWEGDYTLLIAERMGYFEKHGVSVEPIYYEIFYDAVPDLAGAKLDGGLFAVGDMLQVSKLTDVKVVMVYDSGGISAVVAAPGTQTIADLRGKRIGVNLGTSGEMIIRSMLQQADVKAGEVTLVEMSPEQVADNIPARIDAGFIWEPYTSDAIQRGNVLLFSTVSESLVPDVIVFRREIVDARPDDIRAFVAAWFEAVEYRQTHPEESLAIIMEVTGLGAEDLGITGDAKLYNRDDNLRLFSEEPGATDRTIYEIVGINVDFLTTIGDLTEMPDLAEILDPSFLR